jgi:uncharacterized membrane protein YidH (DUF202 family)
MREGVRVKDYRWFAAWVVVGCALALGVVSFALGPLVILPAALVAALMASRPQARRHASGALVGAGLLLLFVAYVNRDGLDATSGNLNPLPWLFLGLAFVVSGFVAQRLRPH